MSDESRARPRLRHLPALDGLRGLAVLAVLAFHDGRLPGGYLGVDLFFVLSGFLITSNLLAEHAATGRIDLRAFWVRRARRLFPALLAVVVSVALLAPLLAPAVDRARIRDEGLAALLYVANWLEVAGGGSYWDLFSTPSPFDHAWSLSIEEQFYVVWPLVACVALRARRSRVALGLVACALAVASASALVHAFDAHGSARAYFGTDTRGAALAAGAVLACALHGRPALPARAVRCLDAAGVLALAGLAVAWVRLDGDHPLLYRGGLWLTELAALVLIACTSQPGSSVVARALAARPLAWLGLVSYGIYLVHWPLFVALSPDRIGLSGAALSAIRWSSALALAAASYRWLEDPIRRRGLRVERPAIVASGCFCAAAAALVVGPVIDGWRRMVPVPAVAHGAVPDVAPANALRLLLVGDSVAVSLGERLDVVGRTTGVRAFVRGIEDCSLLAPQLSTRSPRGVPPAGGDCAASWPADVREVQPDVVLVVLGGGFLSSARISDRWTWACDEAFDDAYAAALSRALDSVRPPSGRVVVTTAPRPVGAWRTDTLDRRTDCFNEVVRTVVQRIAGATLLDLASRVCPRDGCDAGDPEPARPDGLHFQGPAADATASWILDHVGGR